MSQNLNAIIPTLYGALDVVSRELVGFIPAVSRDSGVERAAVDQEVSFQIVPAMSAGDIAAAATGPDPSDTVLGNDTMKITKSRGVTFYWTGEEQRGAAFSGQRENTVRDMFAQAMRTLVNEVESDLGGLYKVTSRAVGVAGTAPFSADFKLTASAKKILDDNGAPLIDRQIVIDTSAGANLRGLSNLIKANEAGTDQTLRSGLLLDLNGFGIRESAKIASHAKGTGTTLATSGTDNDKGSTTVVCAAITAGNVLAGDVLKIGEYYYVAVSADATENTIEIQEPGLMEDVAAAEDVVVQANYTANMAFHRSALQLVTRAPAMPEGGDAADDVIEIQDPVSGLGFQIALYRQRRRIAYEVGLAWGVKATKAAHAALILG